MLLRAAAIRKSYAGVRALDEVSFELRAGEVHAIVGENGAGKSTLIKVFTGAVTPDAGRIEVDGRFLGRLDPHAARAAGIAAIYQQPALFPSLSVAENIALALERGSLWRRIDWGERSRRARELLDAAGASIDPRRLVETLSMPEQQIVEIAKAIGADARIVIMDEPTASLTDREVDALLGLVGRLRDRGVGIIYISHRLDEVFAIADRITVLRDGRTVDTLDASGADRAHLVRLMVGRELSTVFPKRDVAIGGPALEARGIGHRASGIRDVSFTVHEGEIFGIAGLVGSGRTELAEVLFGLRPADEGEILLRGLPAAIGSPEDAIAHGIGYVPEDRRQHGVILPMSVAMNASLADLDRVSRAGLIDGDRERAAAIRLGDSLRIKSPSVDAPVNALSGGNQQKVALARWLATEPSVLLLDEPTQGVDVASKAEIHALMSGLAARGLAIVMISSELPEILGMSDRIAVMRAGRLRGILPRDQATPARVLELALGGPRTCADMRAADHADDTDWQAADYAHDTDRQAPDVRGRRERSMSRRREASVGLAIGALAILLALIAPEFFSRATLVDVFLGNLPVLVAALGALLVILTGEIDISIGSVFAVCGVAAGICADAGLPTTVSACAALVCGAAAGALNGAFVAYLELPSIVVTLASMVAIRDALRWVTQGAWVQDLPPSFQWFGLRQEQFPVVAFVIAAALAAALSWGLRNVGAGRAVYATGSDADAARLAGLDVRLLKFTVFAAGGALTGLAALLNAVRFNQIPSNAGIGLELKVIAAVVVGGAAIRGGRGSVAGSVLGIVLLALIGPALVFLGINAYWERAIQGVIILAAVMADAIPRPRAAAVQPVVQT